MRLNPAFQNAVLPLIIVSGMALGACSSTTLIPVWRPWTRTVGTLESVDPGPYVLRVEGEDHTTVGSPAIIEKQMGIIVEDLLGRRGFERAQGDADLILTLSYRAGSQMTMSSTTVMENRAVASSYLAGLAAANSSNSKSGSVGVAIAALIGIAASSSGSASKVVQSNRPEMQVEYSLALTLQNRAGESLWKGDAGWRSEGKDILTEMYLPLQLLFSEFPDLGVAPRVPRVREDKADTFFEQYCENKWFSSPAVPYRIRLQTSSWSNPIRDEFAYAAYLDLLENAEISVPVSFRYGEDDYTDVTDTYLWRKVLLGGEYLIGPLKERAKILIALEATGTGGYKVEDARVATEEEFSEYRTRLAGWRKALREYYDVFE